MKDRNRALMAAAALARVSLLLIAWPVSAAVEDIYHYQAYSDHFASAGQPTAAQLVDAREAGFQRVIYLAYNDHEHSLPSEDRLVKKLGLQYVHIPVEWQLPTVSDFNLFASAMRSEPTAKTLLHCQANYRASAFAFLYRVLYDGVPVKVAKADMNAVWVPDRNWTNLLLSVLKASNIDANCDGCDWTPRGDT